MPAAPDWRVVLDDFDRARERAFATGDASWLDGLYEPGSALEAADRAALAGLVSTGRTATGVRHELRSVAVVARTPDRVALRTEDLLDAQTVRDSGGATVERRPARGLAAFTVVLVAAGDGWRIGSITPL
ncbi:MAG: serine/threonine protein kinase [Frankiales bacterium]|nr:serine/threonine protein kinase [Frankiales bacterium]